MIEILISLDVLPSLRSTETVNNISTHKGGPFHVISSYNFINSFTANNFINTCVFDLCVFTDNTNNSFRKVVRRSYLLLTQVDD